MFTCVTSTTCSYRYYQVRIPFMILMCLVTMCSAMYCCLPISPHIGLEAQMHTSSHELTIPNDVSYYLHMFMLSSSMMFHAFGSRSMTSVLCSSSSFLSVHWLHNRQARKQNQRNSPDVGRSDQVRGGHRWLSRAPCHHHGLARQHQCGTVPHQRQVGASPRVDGHVEW